MTDYSFKRPERPVEIPAWMDRTQAMTALANARRESEAKWKGADDE